MSAGKPESGRAKPAGADRERSGTAGSHRARKRFGQNFLRDATVIERMLAAMRPEPGQRIIEVGPGLGALTWPLLERAERLTVIEIDRDLAARLERRADPRLEIVTGDVLGIDFVALAGGTPLRLVGNLPYNIGTPLVLRLLEAREAIDDVHVMLQKEVVDRLGASAGTRAWGRLSVLVQSTFEVTPLLAVPPGAFEPPPKVHSAVVRLVPRADAPDAAAMNALSQATRLAFAGKRKTLRNNLRGHLEPAAIEALDIDPGARAETLDLDAFTRLAGALSG